MQNVARNEKGRSCQKVAEQLAESPQYYFHQQNNAKRIKANEDQDFCFSGVSEESRFEWLHKKSRLKNFLNSSDEKGQGSINCFFYKLLILLGR